MWEKIREDLQSGSLKAEELPSIQKELDFLDRLIGPQPTNQTQPNEPKQEIKPVEEPSTFDKVEKFIAETKEEISQKLEEFKQEISETFTGVVSDNPQDKADENGSEEKPGFFQKLKDSVFGKKQDGKPNSNEVQGPPEPSASEVISQGTNDIKKGLADAVNRINEQAKNQQTTTKGQILSDSPIGKLLRSGKTQKTVINTEEEAAQLEGSIGDEFLITGGKFLNLTEFDKQLDSFSIGTLTEGREEILRRFPPEARAEIKSRIQLANSRKLVKPQTQFQQISFGSTDAIKQSIGVIHSELKERFTYPVADQESNKIMNAMIQTESSFNPNAVSETGAMGLGQIVPSTAELIAKKSGLGLTAEQILTDPEANLKAAEWLLFQGIWPSYKDTDNPLAFSIAEYKEGDRAVRKAQEQAEKLDGEGKGDNFEIVKKYLPKITQTHVKKFFQALEEQS